MTPLDLYNEFFPHGQITCYQMSLIEAMVTDMDRWRQTLEFWAGNAFRAQSVLKMIDYYDKLQPPIRRGPTQTEAIEAEQRMIEAMALEQ